MKQAMAWFLPVVFLQLFGLGAVGQTIPPSVDLLSPPNGAAIPGPSDILIAAHAFDPDGQVVSVEFLVNGGSLGLGQGISTPLFSFFYLLWENVGAGEYEIVAVATDNDGLTTESDPVTITVYESPEPVVVGVVSTDPEATEPGPLTDVLDTATFTFRRSGSTDDPLDVYFSLHGEAIAGEDYAEVPTVITIPAGRSWAHLLIEPLDDDLVEGDERVVVRIEPVDCEDVVNCYDVSRYNRARAVIHDNDRPPNLPPRVRLLHPENGQVFLAPAEIALVAGAFDLDGQVVQVEFFEGDNSLGVVPTPEISPSSVLDANDIATHPLYRLLWDDVAPGHYVLTAVATDDDGDEGRSLPVEIRVVEIQPPPVVTLTATDEEGTEPDDSTIAPDVAVFTVHRTGNLQRPLTVHYRIGGSAENGVDYAQISRRVILPIGARTADIIVRPLDDLLHEGDESVLIRLAPCATIADIPMPVNACYRVGDPNRARAVIHDNDPPPPNHPPRVKLVHPVDGTVFRAPADIRLVAAAHDVDGWVRAVEFFANGESVGLVPSNQDPIEFFRLLWEDVGPGPYELVAVAIDNDGDSTASDPVHIRVIQVPDIPVVNVFAVDPIAFEGPATGGVEPDTATFAVVRSGSTDDALHVRYVLAGSATPGEDYEDLSGEVIIEEGESAARVVIVPIDDNLPERLETVDLRVVQRPCVSDVAAPFGCYRVGQHPADWAYIVDDDPFPNIPPRVEIIRPEEGSEIPGPTDIRVVAAAHDVDGFVRSVEFFANGQSIGIVTAPPPGSLAPVAVGETALAPELQYPWQILWQDVQPGAYRLTAIATDNDGAQTESLVNHIQVFAEPDPTVVEVKATDPKATEPDRFGTHFDPAEFTICRSGSMDHPLRVHFWLRGVAENGLDYRQIPTSAVIAAGEECVTVPIDPIDDNLVEGQESVILVLREVPCDGTAPALGTHLPNCYMVGRQHTARAVISPGSARSRLKKKKGKYLNKWPIRKFSGLYGRDGGCSSRRAR